MSNSKHTRIWRLLAVIGSILMFIATIRLYGKLTLLDNFFFSKENEFIPDYIIFCVNIISFIAFIYLILKPLSFTVYFVFSFYYTVVTIIEGGNYTSFFFFILTLLCAYRSGFFIKKMQVKVILSFILFFLLLLTQIRFGFDVLLKSILKICELLLILSVTALMLSEEISKFIKLNNPSILILSDYPDLLERDKVFLKAVFAGEKFDYIASINSISPGTARNRMREVYKILGVADKTELLIRYSACKD